MEEPVNPLLYVLAYGAGFVAQGTPADMPGLAAMIEEAIRFPGFAFVNVQSPCVTFGEEEQQLKAHKAHMKSLASLGHDPADRLKAMELAPDYGKELLHGRLLPQPRAAADLRRPGPASARRSSSRRRLPRERILDLFRRTPEARR